MALRNNLGLLVNGRLKIHWISKSSIWWVPNFRLKYSPPSNTWVETRVQLRTNTWSAGLHTGRTIMVIVNQPFYNSNHVTDLSSSSDAKKAVEFTSAAVCSNFFGCPFCRCPWSSLFFSLGFWEASSLPTGLPLLDLCSLKIGFEVRPSAPPTSSAAGDIEIACANPWPACLPSGGPRCYGHRGFAAVLPKDKVASLLGTVEDKVGKPFPLEWNSAAAMRFLEHFSASCNFLVLGKGNKL